jgi:hypothetical protein
MAVNPTTGIDPVNDRFVYVEAFDAETFDPNDKATYRVLNHNELWREDGEPRVGVNPRFMRFKKLPDQELETDHRYSVNTTPVMLVSGSLPITDASLPVGTYQITKQAVLRSLDELLSQIETEYQRQVRLQFPDTENPTTIMFVGAASLKKQAGGVLTPAEEILLANYLATTDKVRLIADRKMELDAAAIAGEDYDLTFWPTFE